MYKSYKHVLTTYIYILYVLGCIKSSISQYIHIYKAKHQRPTQLTLGKTFWRHLLRLNLLNCKCLSRCSAIRTQPLLGGFKHVVFFYTEDWGNDPIWRFFSDGLDILSDKGWVFTGLGDPLSSFNRRGMKLFFNPDENDGFPAEVNSRYFWKWGYTQERVKFGAYNTYNYPIAKNTKGSVPHLKQKVLHGTRSPSHCAFPIEINSFLAGGDVLW